MAALEDEPPDLILLDVMMPGSTAGRCSAGSRSATAWPIPVIMFSGKVDELGRRCSVTPRRQGFLGKPFNPQDLITRPKSSCAPSGAIAGRSQALVE